MAPKPTVKSSVKLGKMSAARKRPRPDMAEEQRDGKTTVSLSPKADGTPGWGVEASAEAVASRLAALGMTEPQLMIREGYFAETFSSGPQPQGPISFLMVDCY